MRKAVRRRLSPEAIALVAERFGALADPLRLRILEILHRGERNVGELTVLLGTSQPNVSRQLKVLREEGFVGRRAEGTAAFWFIADPGVFELCDLVCAGLQDRLTVRARLFAGDRSAPRRRKS